MSIGKKLSKLAQETRTPKNGDQSVLRALSGLTAQEREFVRRYTDPLLPSFGNIRESAQLAGYSPESGYAVVKRETVQTALDAIAREREMMGREVENYLSQYSMEAAKEIISQLGQGKGLNMIDPTEALDLNKQDGMSRVTSTKLKEINAHNRNVISAAKERREAAKIIVAYQIGTPEQQVKIRHEKEMPDVLDLATLDADQLRELSSMVNQVRAAKESDPQILEAEVIE